PGPGEAIHEPDLPPAESLGAPTAAPDPTAAAGSSPQFSVIVPTRGDPKRLLPLLDALERQTLDLASWELILATEAPALDPAVERRVRSRPGGARVVQAGGGPAAARNAGAAAARARWLAFTEDDCTPAPDWLERAAAALAAHSGAELLSCPPLRPAGRAA